jgi:polyribonucleotide nucleotidyltransferase
MVYQKSLEAKRLSIQVQGKEIILETGKIARQASGAVVLQSGGTVILATACQAPKPAEGADFLPLRVDYQEKFSSAGKTLGGFIKREGKPSEKEVLTSRLIDRPLRPIFEDGYYNEVQVLAYVLSYDNQNPPEGLAITAAAAALYISEVPLKKPVAGVCIGMIDGEFILNPTVEQLKKSKLELMLAGTKDAILMIEGNCDFLTEEQVLEAIEFGHTAIKHICEKLADWNTQVGKEKNRSQLVIPPKELYSAIESIVTHSIHEAMHIEDKKLREEALNEVSKKVSQELIEVENPQFSAVEVQIAYKEIKSRVMRKMITQDKRRSDGRKFDEIRPIFIESSVLPRTHGSALFTRGETQALAVCTLGGESMGQRYEDLEGEALRKFYLQYTFPPFSVGEVGRLGSPGRREVGHGKLAEKALQAVLPSETDFPYTIRLESNITESNGSSSMASVCGGCLAMMDAGIPIKRPVAGIAMGLILEENSYVILSDILGVEDALGDMDFKVTGDNKGITAFQLDIKVEGITPKIMEVALKQAKEGRQHILQKMLEAMPRSKETLSEFAPRIEIIKIKPSKVALVIGPGGKQIKAIIAETGVDININDEGEEAIVSIASNNAEAMEKAKAMVHNIVAEVEVGKTYRGKIVSIVAFGAFVQILNKEGLCHVSELSHSRIEKVEDHFKVGDMLDVKVLEVNDRGQIRLSHKALLPKPQAS